MEIQLKSTIDVELVQSCGGDHMVVAAAKVSTNGIEAKKFADPELADDNYGLINYLLKHRHGTPVEHGSMTFFVHAPIFVWREWHRHRIAFGFSEESGRYKKLSPTFYVPSNSRKLVKVKEYKSARPLFEDNPEGLTDTVSEKLAKSYEQSYKTYEELLALNIDNGLARACLPVALYSGCWVTCNPRSLMHFLSLRTHEPNAKFVSYPLQEIEFAARACEEIFAELWPLTYKAFCENGRVAP